MPLSLNPHPAHVSHGVAQQVASVGHENQREPDIQRAAMTLSASADRLRESVGALFLRLEQGGVLSVGHPDPPSTAPGNDQKPDTRATLAIWFDELAAQQCDLALRVDRIRARLEV